MICPVCNRPTEVHAGGRLVCTTCEKFVDSCVCSQLGGAGWLHSEENTQGETEMPIKDTQGDLSHGAAVTGLPPSNFEIEVVRDDAPNGENARNTGEISTDRTSEDH